VTPDPASSPWLDPEQLALLDPMLELLAGSHVSLSSVTDSAEARRVHVADSLSGLACPEVRDASQAIDLGAGAGFPGIPLARFLPSCEFTLLDSVGRKVDFMNEVISALGLTNARAIKDRSETWAESEGREKYDLVTARAVAPLSALAELSSPLLAEGGHLVAWKGESEPESERVIEEYADRLAMKVLRQEAVVPFPGSRERRLYVLTKTGPTPDGLPRRPGMARKRPLGGD
jgi:16S rRNA (guanine527-N7)-methyltransferase